MSAQVFGVFTWPDDLDDSRRAVAAFVRRIDAEQCAVRMQAAYDADTSRAGRLDGAPARYTVAAFGVAGEARTCALCGLHAVTATDPDCDYCRGCYYTGRADERRLGALIRQVEAHPLLACSVWHTGGGCMVFAAWRRDKGEEHPFVTATEAYEVGGKWEAGEPGVPETAAGPWGADVWPSQHHWNQEVDDWDWTPVATLAAPASGLDLVTFIREQLCPEVSA